MAAMLRSAASEWGPCPCGGVFAHHVVDVRITVAGRAVTLNDVPQGRCPSCGSRVYKAEELARIEGTMVGEPVDRRLSLVKI
jgi:YgiT-type zinc finger domain-containing protein